MLRKSCGIINDVLVEINATLPYRGRELEYIIIKEKKIHINNANYVII